MNPLPQKLNPETARVYNGDAESARRYPSSCEQNPAVDGGPEAAAFEATDPRLADVILSWRDLPEAVRVGIVAMIEAATQ